MEVKKWVEWCDRCGHGFKIEADDIFWKERFAEEKVPVGFIGKLLGKKKTKKIIKTGEIIKPEASTCPVCGKADDVTVIKLQEDHIADIE